MASQPPWTLVLAAGEGSRLRRLTVDLYGNVIPKQFCALVGEASLLETALLRAARFSPPERIATVVAERHEPWWRGPLGLLDRANITVQPCNRGTAVGLLVPLLSILHRDPGARVVMLPSDHFVADEGVLARAVGHALIEIVTRPGRVVLLGIEPDESDSEFGWIVPARADHGDVAGVRRFVEKPPAPVAGRLKRRGALWNSFILVAEGRKMCALLERRMPGAVAAVRDAIERDPGITGDAQRLAALYDELETIDLSRDVLEDSVDDLAVLPVPPCGWCDLGTPVRVARCRERLTSRDVAPVVDSPGLLEPVGV